MKKATTLAMVAAAILLLLVLANVNAMAQWQRTAGGEGGDVRDIASNGRTVLALVWPDALYRFDTQWNRLGETAIHDIRGGAGVYFGFSRERGMLRSTDDGTTWTPAGPGKFVTNILFDGDTVYAAANNEIHRSTDAGTSWTVTAETGRQIDAFFVDGSTILMRTSLTTTTRSTDGGATWHDAGAGLPTGAFIGKIIEANGAWWAIVGGAGVYGSVDAGLTWSTFNAGLEQSNPLQMAVADIQAIGADVVIATRAGVYHLSDGVWMRALREPNGSFATFDDGMLVGGAYVRQSTDGGQLWHSMTGGMFAQTANDLAAVGNQTIMTTAAGIYRKFEGTTWIPVHPIASVEIVRSGASHFARAEQITGMGVLRSTDDGRTWNPIARDLEDDQRDISALAAGDRAVVIGFKPFITFNMPGDVGKGIYRSTDNGATWIEANDGIPTMEHDHVAIEGLAGVGSTFLAHTDTAIYSSTDDGATWRSTGFRIQPGATVGDFAAIGDTFWITIDGQLFSLMTDGMQWEAIGNALPENLKILNLSKISGKFIVSAADADEMMTGTTRRIFQLEGTEWREITDRFPAGVPFTHFLDQDGNIYGATNGQGVWMERTVASVEDEAEESQLALVGAPNPAGAEMTLYVASARGGCATLTLADATGRIVATPLDEAISAGSRTIRLDVAALSAGIYFARLVVDGESRTTTIVKTP